MLPLRTELQIYSDVCETLLSSVLKPDLTGEEQDLIVYYATELYEKFDHHRNDQSRLAKA